MILLVLSGVIAPKAGAASPVFSDVPSTHGFYTEVSYLLDKGVISPSKKYGVDEKVTRAEVAVMVSKSVGLDGAKKATKFKDVPATHNASGYIDSAVKSGIISGYSDGTFRPNELVDRGQMAIFLARAYSLSVESPANFKDMSPSVASYSSVKKIIQAKITTGFSDNTFRPAEKLTRGQISAFLARAMQSGKTPTPPTSAKDMKVHFIDVGQGDAILVQSPNGKNMLIDAGTRDKGSKVVSFLKSKGVSSLDIVVATHPHADHIGGLITVLNSFPVGQFVDSGNAHTTQTYLELLELIDAKNIPFTVAQNNDKLNLDTAISATILHSNEQTTSANDASVVTRIVYGSVSFLLTGDAEKAVETDLVARYGNLLRSTYLKAGHHGSNSSSTQAFLNAVKPTGTILSYAEGNMYGHPHDEVVLRLNALGSKMYSTAISGDITVTTNGSTHAVSVQPWSGGIVTGPPTTPKPEPEKPAPGVTYPININTASYELLQEITGVGPVIAQRIIDYRKTRPFNRIEDIMKISGIGQATFDKMKHQITVK